MKSDTGLPMAGWRKHEPPPPAAATKKTRDSFSSPCIYSARSRSAAQDVLDFVGGYLANVDWQPEF